jgi:DNA-binding LacI/PurR family transcriptional regulator
MRDKLKRFLELRPAINVAEFAREVGVSRQFIDYILIGKNNPSEDTAKSIVRVMRKYGYRTTFRKGRV